MDGCQFTKGCIDDFWGSIMQKLPTTSFPKNTPELETADNISSPQLDATIQAETPEKEDKQWQIAGLLRDEKAA